VTENELYTTCVKKLNSCSIIQSYSGAYLKSTLGYVKNLLKYLKVNTGIEFSEMVCDFIKDEAGTWWMINVKSFIIKLKIPKQVSKRNFDWREQMMERQKQAEEAYQSSLDLMGDIWKDIGEKSKAYGERKNKKFSISGH